MAESETVNVEDENNRREWIPFSYLTACCRDSAELPVQLCVIFLQTFITFHFAFDLERLIPPDRSVHRLIEGSINIVIRVLSTWNLESFLRQKRRSCAQCQYYSQMSCPV